MLTSENTSDADPRDPETTISRSRQGRVGALRSPTWARGVCPSGPYAKSTRTKREERNRESKEQRRWATWPKKCTTVQGEGGWDDAERCMSASLCGRPKAVEGYPQKGASNLWSLPDLIVRPSFPRPSAAQLFIPEEVL